MSPISSKDVPSISSVYNPDLQWSFNPVFLLLQMFGVSINHSIPLSALKRIISLCVGTIIITWSLATNASSIFQWEPDPYKGKWIKVFSKLIGPLANIWLAANLFWFAQVAKCFSKMRTFLTMVTIMLCKSLV